MNHGESLESRWLRTRNLVPEFRVVTTSDSQMVLATKMDPVLSEVGAKP
jgi:hypothetical protein